MYWKEKEEEEKEEAENFDTRHHLQNNTIIKFPFIFLYFEFDLRVEKKESIFRHSSHKRVSNAPTPFFVCSKLTCSIFHNDIFVLGLFNSQSFETIFLNIFIITKYASTHRNEFWPKQTHCKFKHRKGNHLRLEALSLTFFWYHFIIFYRARKFHRFKLFSHFSSFNFKWVSVVRMRLIKRLWLIKFIVLKCMQRGIHHSDFKYHFILCNKCNRWQMTYHRWCTRKTPYILDGEEGVETYKCTWISYICILYVTYKTKYIIYNCTICQFYCSPSDDAVWRATNIYTQTERSERTRNNNDDIVIVYFLFNTNLRLSNK